MEKAMPFWLSLFGLFALFFFGNEYLAIGCFFFSIIMTIDRIWPSVKDE